MNLTAASYSIASAGAGGQRRPPYWTVGTGSAALVADGRAAAATLPPLPTLPDWTG